METGHAKNVANFYDLIAIVTAHGATYAPTKPALKLTALNTLYNTAKTALTDTIDRATTYNTRVNQRIIAFTDLKALATRLVNALEATDATA